MRSRVYVESIKLVTRVATASDENGRMPAVQIRRTEIVLGGTMPRAVAPGCRPVRLARFQPFARVRHPFLAVFTDFVQLARGSLHVEQIFIVGHGILGIVNPTDIMGHIAHLRDRTVRMMDNHVVSPTHQHLCLAVTIPVESYGIELFIGSRLHVRADVDVPQPFSLDVVHLDAVVSRSVGHVRHSGRTRIKTLGDNLRHPVAIDIGQHGIVEHIVFRQVLAVTSFHFRARHSKEACILSCKGIETEFLETFDGVTLFPLLAFHHGSHRISGFGRSSRMDIVTRRQPFGHQLTVGIKVVSHIVVLLAQHTPTHEVSTSALGDSGHKAASQFVHRPLGTQIHCAAS